jgi:hypothetical protein
MGIVHVSCGGSVVESKPVGKLNSRQASAHPVEWPPPGSLLNSVLEVRRLEWPARSGASESDRVELGTCGAG